MAHVQGILAVEMVGQCECHLFFFINFFQMRWCCFVNCSRQGGVANFRVTDILVEQYVCYGQTNLQWVVGPTGFINYKMFFHSTCEERKKNNGFFSYIYIKEKL